MGGDARIAKNAAYLYVRTALSTLIGIYTARVVLQTLGVGDYGIYSVTGGIIGMLGFLNASMSGATSRFLAFELGRGDARRLRDTFSSAIAVHGGIAVIVLVFAETAGLWLVSHRLVIPAERSDAALWVYHCSIVTTLLSIMQTPYTASMMAREHFRVYACLELFGSLAKLGTLWLVVASSFDRLVTYAVLNVLISVVYALFAYGYCVRHFAEARFRPVFDRRLLRPMLSFSGWDLYGNMSVSVRQQGLNVLINMFWGTVMNAASGVAATVNGTLLGLGGNFVAVFRPPIIKAYAQGDVSRMVELTLLGGRYAALVLVAFAVPLFIEMDCVMRLWLANVPPRAADFCRILLVQSLFVVVNNTIVIGIHATGRVKAFSFVSGTLQLATLPLTLCCFRLGLDVTAAYVVPAVMSACIMLFNYALLRSRIRAFTYKIFAAAMARVLLVIVATVALPVCVACVWPDGYGRLVAVIACSLLCFLPAAYGVALEPAHRIVVRHKVRAAFLRL